MEDSHIENGEEARAGRWSPAGGREGAKVEDSRLEQDERDRGFKDKTKCITICMPGSNFRYIEIS